jgi:hypothetical protein
MLNVTHKNLNISSMEVVLFSIFAMQGPPLLPTCREIWCYVNRLLSFCAAKNREDKRLLGLQKRKRLVVQKFPEGNGRRKTETELNSDSKGNSMFQENDSLCCLCVPHELRSMPCLLNHALCNKTRDPRYVHCV